MVPATHAAAAVRSPDPCSSLFVHQHPIVDEAGQAIGMEVPAQRGFIVVLAYPVEEGLSSLRDPGVMMKEGIEDSGFRLPDMAEAQRKLLQCLRCGAALEQHEQTCRQSRPIGTRLAMDQGRRAHLPVDIVQSEDTLALRRTAALECHVDE